MVGGKHLIAFHIWSIVSSSFYNVRKDTLHGSEKNDLHTMTF